MRYLQLAESGISVQNKKISVIGIFGNEKKTAFYRILITDLLRAKAFL